MTRARASSRVTGPPPRSRSRRASSPRGLFVTFEGIEGSGKTTQVERLARRLRTAGVPVVVTREPGGTSAGARLRSLLLDRDEALLAPAAEALVYAADRAQHIEELILPALRRGALVLCDRYLDATLAYQGFGRRLGVERILEIHRCPPLDLRPDRTILLDHDPRLGLPRARLRSRHAGIGRSEGRIEAEGLPFHRRVRRGYLRLAADEPARFRVIPAEGTPSEVEARVRAALADLLPVLDIPPGRGPASNGRT